MRVMKLLTRSLILIACGRGACAYLDPGSGSLIVQILIAIIVGIAATFRLWKARLLSLFGIKQERNDDADGDGTENHDVNQV